MKAAFELRLLCLAGYEPLLDACADCGEEEQEKQRFSTADGVLRCDDCAQGTKEEFQLTGPALSAMRYISSADARRLFSFTLEENALDLLEQVRLWLVNLQVKKLDFQ
ncbi:DNA repair protein RecO [bioreactor metagenome]|uniref:DNA repair protein RecO n=1 Tax=bioreactor metagenome TaxID=1076179 RepID=A0A645IWB9_9ZZZZ